MHRLIAYIQQCRQNVGEFFFRQKNAYCTLDTSIIGDPDIFRNLLDIPYTYLIYLDYLK